MKRDRRAKIILVIARIRRIKLSRYLKNNKCKLLMSIIQPFLKIKYDKRKGTRKRIKPTDFLNQKYLFL